MIVLKQDFGRSGLGPAKSYTPLQIDANRETPANRVKVIRGRLVEILEALGGVQITKAFERLPLKIGGNAANGLPFPNLLCGRIGKALNHRAKHEQRGYFRQQDINEQQKYAGLTLPMGLSREDASRPSRLPNAAFARGPPGKQRHYASVNSHISTGLTASSPSVKTFARNPPRPISQSSAAGATVLFIQ